MNINPCPESYLKNCNSCPELKGELKKWHEDFETNNDSIKVLEMMQTLGILAFKGKEVIRPNKCNNKQWDSFIDYLRHSVFTWDYLVPRSAWHISVLNITNLSSTSTRDNPYIHTI